MSLFVGVDPAAGKPTAYAIMTGSGLVLDAGLLDFPDITAFARFAPIHLARIIKSKRCTVDETVTLVIEGQYLGRVRSFAGDIIDLSRFAGAILSTASHLDPVTTRVLMPTPQQWKGSIPKPQHQKQILTKLPSLQDMLTPFDAKERVDLIDAAGLALWAWEGGEVPKKLSKPKKKPLSPFKKTRHPVEFENEDLGEEG